MSNLHCLFGLNSDDQVSVKNELQEGGIEHVCMAYRIIVTQGYKTI